MGADDARLGRKMQIRNAENEEIAPELTQMK